MGKCVICVDELRLIDPYTIRYDYFMGMEKRLIFLTDCTDKQKKCIYKHDLMEYLEVGRELRLVPDRVYTKIFNIIFDCEV